MLSNFAVNTLSINKFGIDKVLGYILTLLGYKSASQGSYYTVGPVYTIKAKPRAK